MVDEQWAEIAGFPDYAVSNHGRILNLRFNSYLKPRSNSYGYLRVGLRRDGQTHDIYVHQLVAAAFISGHMEGIQVRHEDGDPSNNRVDNLRFRRGARLGHLVRNPPKALVRRVRVCETGEVFANVSSLSRYIGGDASSIYRVLRGERVSHRGLSFEHYFEET